MWVSDYAVWITENSDNQGLDNRGPTVQLFQTTIKVKEMDYPVL